MPRDLIMVQARLSSTRLPGKVLKPLWQGKHLLDIQLEKLKNIGIPFVLATSTNTADDLLAAWAHDNKVECFRGNEANVLTRFIDCARQYKIQRLIRVCSDNPFIQLDQVPHYLDKIGKGLDYISYCNDQGTPAIRTHWGLFVEGVSFKALEKAADLLANHPDGRFYSEHVTNFIYGHPDQFNIKLERAPAIVVSRDDLRFTIDTSDDFNNMGNLLQAMNGNTNDLESLIRTTDNDSAFLEIMKNGIQSFDK